MMMDGRLCVGGGAGYCSVLVLPCHLLERIGISNVSAAASFDATNNNLRDTPATNMPPAPVMDIADPFGSTKKRKVAELIRIVWNGWNGCLFLGPALRQGISNLIMGKMYLLERAVKVNFKKSDSNFRTAINSGNSEAYAYLGLQYQRGLGLEKDERQALALYLLSRELGIV